MPVLLRVSDELTTKLVTLAVIEIRRMQRCALRVLKLAELQDL